MRVLQTTILSAAALALSCASTLAGPCTADIDRAQAQVDARIAAKAQAGPMAAESPGALLHRQPTPGSIATAEQRLGEGARPEEALAMLARARDADNANDAPACARALADVTRILNP
ncbi:MAG: hypothetical protein ABWY78_04455 [Microvirga sp.]